MSRAGLSATWSRPKVVRSLLFNRVTKSIMGARTWVSKSSLRGVNHSRRLFFSKVRKKEGICLGNPINRVAIVDDCIPAHCDGEVETSSLRWMAFPAIDGPAEKQNRGDQ